MSVEKTLDELLNDFSGFQESWEREIEYTTESELGEFVEYLGSSIEDSSRLESLAKNEKPLFVGVKDNWDEVRTFDARIIEIKDSSVVLDCLMDRENKHFETRIFNKRLFKNFNDLNEGQYILIRQFSKPGKITFTLNNGEKLVNKEYFESHPEFSDLDQIENKEIDLSKI